MGLDFDFLPLFVKKNRELELLRRCVFNGVHKFTDPFDFRYFYFEKTAMSQINFFSLNLIQLEVVSRIFFYETL